MNVCPKANECIWKNECLNAKPHKHIKGICKVVKEGKYSWCHICADYANYKKEPAMKK